MLDAHSTIVFAPKFNRPDKRADATGAFQPAARRFMTHHGINPSMYHLIDNKQNGRDGKATPKDKARMRQQVLTAIDKCTQEGIVLRGAAFFCHGYKSGIQFGFTSKNVNQLASSLDCASHKNLRVPLYACDAGRDADRYRRDDLEAFGGDGGFADILRDALCRYGLVDNIVWAHTTPGHTLKNSHVRVFPGMGSEIGNTGGFYVIHPKDRKLWRAWKAAIKDKDNTLELDFPFMEIAEIHRTVLALTE